MNSVSWKSTEREPLPTGPQLFGTSVRRLSFNRIKGNFAVVCRPLVPLFVTSALLLFIIDPKVTFFPFTDRCKFIRVGQQIS